MKLSSGVYFNEFDAYPAEWLRNLYPQAIVDQRSIADVRGEDVRDYRRCHFFGGIGGWEYALQLAEWPDDIPVWTGSCPCQPFSVAGNQRGTADERHLWPEFLRLIAECRPPVVFGEQVASKAGRDWLSDVRSDLEALGYEVGCADLCAAGVSAPHLRQRLYWVAHSYGTGGKRLVEAGHSSLSGSWGWCGQEDLCLVVESPYAPGARWPQPLIRKMDDGVPDRVGRLRAYGNAIVPQVAAVFIQSFKDVIHEAN